MRRINDSDDESELNFEGYSDSEDEDSLEVGGVEIPEVQNCNKNSSTTSGAEKYGNDNSDNEYVETFIAKKSTVWLANPPKTSCRTMHDIIA